MTIEGSTALVTGANRGIGREFARQLLERGAARVYAGARDPGSVDLPGVVPIALDVTDPASVAAAADTAPDVDLLINNAGVSLLQDPVGGELAALRQEMEVNYWGIVVMARAFAPILGGRPGGGAMLNVLSRVSWLAFPGVGGYAASKAAAWSLTNSLRLELAPQGTLVTALHLSSTDTDMMAGWDIPKNDPAEVVRAALDGIEAGEIEVIADDETADTKALLSAHPSELYAPFLAAAS